MKHGNARARTDRHNELDFGAFERHISADLGRVFHSLSSPVLIQAYLDSLPYVAEELDRSPLRVLTDGQAHCLDGGLFAAVALNRIGHRALILDLVPAPGRDDDHVLALYKYKGCWGSIAKSNYAGLRYRAAVYRSLRELAMSYFDVFFNNDRERTLRSYTRPLDLSGFPSEWMWSDAGVARITARFYSQKPISLITASAASTLAKVDDRTFRSSTVGTDFNWIFGVRPGARPEN